MSFSSRGEPTRRGGIGGSLRFEGSWRREREEMRRGKAGREGRGDGTRGGEGMRGGGTQRDMQERYRSGSTSAGSLEQRAESSGGTAGERAWAAEEVHEEASVYIDGGIVGAQKKGAGGEGRSAIRAVKGRRGVWHYPSSPSDSDAHAARFGHAFDFGLHSKHLEPAATNADNTCYDPPISSHSPSASVQSITRPRTA